MGLSHKSAFIENATINNLLGEGFIKIGRSFPKLYKFQNTDYHGATFLMGKMKIKNINVFDHNFVFAWAMKIKFIPLWTLCYAEKFKSPIEF